MLRNRFHAVRLLTLALALLLACPCALADVAPVDPLSGGAPVPAAESAPEAEPAPETVIPEGAIVGDPIGEERPVVVNPLAGVGGEEAVLTDAESQDWYDEMFARMSNYRPPQGKVTQSGALRAPGQETLSPIEVEILLALEGAQMDVSDLIPHEGRMNILLLGIDARPGQKTGRSDSMILVSVELGTSRIKQVSFMRDLYVQIPGLGPNRLNAAYINGGYDMLAAALASNFGVSADHYVAVDFSVLGSLIDQLGGLEIDVKDSYFVDRINAVIEHDNEVLGINKNDGKLKGPGLQVLTGKQAQAYARFRYGARSGGDFARTGRQREVIMKIFEKVQGKTVLELADLATKNIDAVRTDLTLVDLIRLVPTVLGLKNATFEELRVPSDGKFKNQTMYGMAVLVPDMKKTVAELRDFFAD